MSKKRYRLEKVFATGHEANILIGQAHTVAYAIKSISVTDATYYRWRQEFGRMSTSPA